MTINGEPRELDVPEQRLLIDAIRYDMHGVREASYLPLAFSAR